MLTPHVMSWPEATVSKPINLALQGGGAHGALTWGVLDRLLEDERLSIRDVSSTSAGAMNAVVLADGYVRGGPEGARRALDKFWRAVSDATRFSPLRRTAWEQAWGRYSLDYSPGYLLLDSMSRMFSPYELNPFGYNPMRDLLDAQVDFQAVNQCPDVRVFVTATNIRTDRPRVFGPGEITLDAVMASACAPQTHPAVEIDGEAYWDGGYTGSPALYPLVVSPAAHDIVVVQINPIERRAAPRSTREIINRINEIAFNSGLVKELRSIALLQEAARSAEARGLDLRPYNETLLHLIHVDTEVQDLTASSKLNGEWPYLKMLFERGRSWAGGWLADSYEQLGKSSTLDHAELFGDAHLPAPELEPTLSRRVEGWTAPSPMQLPI